MSIRGRGTLEIRPCDNPFFQPVSADIGLTTTNTNLEWKGSGPVLPNATPYKVDGNFSFLYSRESDKIGSKVAKPPTSEVRILSRSEFLKQRRDKAMEGFDQDYWNTVSRNAETTKPAPEDFLRSYKHVPKEEDPRYITSGNDYGRKPPSVATIVTERAVRPQGFSKSFQNIKPKNTSLTTSLTKSNVHKKLDPQFA